MSEETSRATRASPKLHFTADELGGSSEANTTAGASTNPIKPSIKRSKLLQREILTDKPTSFRAEKAANVTQAQTDSASSKPNQQKKAKSPSKLHHAVEKPIRAAGDQFHRQAVKANDGENIGADAALRLEEASRDILQMHKEASYSHKLRKTRQADRKERQLEKTGTRQDDASKNYPSDANSAQPNGASETAKHTTAANKERDTPHFQSNPYSRWQQKRAIKKEYASAKNGSLVSQAQRTAQNVSEKAKSILESIRENPKVWLAGILGGMLLFVMSGLQSCTPLAQSVLESIVIGTYPAEEKDVRAAERAYADKENELKKEMADYEKYHPGYNEYIVEADDIWHDPYVLIAIISAVYDGEDWNMDKAMPVIEKYFTLQYVVSEQIDYETRYTTQQHTGTRIVTDPETGQTHSETYTYTESVPYTYTICRVSLENRNLSHLPVLSMSHHTMGMYALYMATHGNMEGIFHGNPHATPLRDPTLYSISQEALDADPVFATLIEEAEKYIGYPYVWGGASPETSFDCSGFVSYVFTNSGVYNTGRLGATGLYHLCRTVSPNQAKPGDIVFFEGTMGEKVDGITHCGIYVGNNRMIHCGNPIGYADLSESYWQKHLHSFGRVPGQ